MAAPWHNIEEKAEDAVTAYLETEATLTGLTVFKGFSGSNVTVPSLEVFAESAIPEVWADDSLSGNWDVEITTRIRSNLSATTRAAHAGFVAQVRDVLMQNGSAVVAGIETKATADFTAQIWTPGEAVRLVDDDREERITEQTWTLRCRPSDLA